VGKKKGGTKRDFCAGKGRERGDRKEGRQNLGKRWECLGLAVGEGKAQEKAKERSPASSYLPSTD